MTCVTVIVSVADNVVLALSVAVTVSVLLAEGELFDKSLYWTLLSAVVQVESPGSPPVALMVSTPVDELKLDVNPDGLLDRFNVSVPL